MARLFLTLIFLWSVTHASAQAVPPLTGRVLDQSSQQGIPGAAVVLPDLQQATATAPDGTFQLSNLPKGRFLLEIRSLGYRTVTQEVNTAEGTTLEIGLSTAATELGQVVVTGVSGSTEARRSPLPTTVVERAGLRSLAATNAVDALARTPGVSQLTAGPAISKVVIRGLTGSRVIQLNDGARQEGQKWDDLQGVETDEYSVGRAEIVKGPGSLLYGSDGLGGVVNFLTPEPVGVGHTVGSVMSNYQSNNNLLGLGLTYGGHRASGLNWMARATGKAAGNYENRYDGRVQNSGYREVNVNGYVGLNRRWGYAHLTLTSFNQQLGIVEGVRDPATGQFLKRVSGDGATLVRAPATAADLSGYDNLLAPSQLVEHHRIGLDNSFVLRNGGRLAVNVGWQLNQRREFADSEAGNPGEFELSEAALYFLLRTLDYTVRYYLPERNGWNTTLGLSGMQQHNSIAGEEFLIPEYRLLDGGLYAVTRKTLGKLDLSGGLRLDGRHLSGDALYLDRQAKPRPAHAGPGTDQKFVGFSSSYRNVAGSLGAAFRLSDALVLKANLARGFRAPNIAELASNGQHEGTTRYELGDNTLKAETSLQVDAGLSYAGPVLSVGVDAFLNHIDHYIFARRLLNRAGTADSTNAAQDRIFKYAQGNAALYGGEATLYLHLLPWLHFENSFSMVRAEQLNVPAENQKYLPFIPADRLQSELRANFRRQGKRITNPYARVQLEHTFAQNRFFSAFDTETATPGYTLVNAGLGTDLANAQGKTLFSLFITANNLFDVGYQSHLSRLKYADYNYASGRRGVFNQGRNVSLRLVVPLAFK
ncbi:energy transducer TonB [Hymenobacter sedentarius]|uniref:Energy transducer TonB n=1 Tax=Hymenobacter sedentarius TaxID=1411621 RepID=A0A0U4BL26_9BACT|nr:TonB-dependent receptor [Hymenobacter sedentarius]ALW84394.1 energy transducer TonB [Hymenobacter sedentarius]